MTGVIKMNTERFGAFLPNGFTLINLACTCNGENEIHLIISTDKNMIHCFFKKVGTKQVISDLRRPF